jgi:hypothetical protein
MTRPFHFKKKARKRWLKSAKREIALAEKFEKEGTKQEFAPGLRRMTEISISIARRRRRKKKSKKSK